MEKVCGLDVHKDSVFMCILKENGEKIEEKFDTYPGSRPLAGFAGFSWDR